ncbi:protein kinase domain-containing protein [Nocardia anaemiae]|uniref:protein kinase domain-containing protein n=1 Tax=Nocardia anaemiae TaxID=263910 RepID=UPI0007A387CD|nr:protein kinase [Nocardia anaemiae]
MTEWRAGDVVADLYEVREVIESGALGLVYRVWHRGWNAELAVKVPRPELLDSPSHVSDFESEARTWVKLGMHANTVACAYVRRIDGIPRVFAEWVDGGSLADAVRRRRLYDGEPEHVMARILDIAIQFAWGLGHAHAAGLVHRDVKPDNVMLTRDWNTKVTDFGLAQAQHFGLTPAYCSPEQAHAATNSSEILTPATDVWSWAVSVWEMFVGEPPCRYGQTARAVFESFLSVHVAQAPGIPSLPRQLADILLRCFALDPAERPQSMGQLADGLIALYPELTGAEYPRPRPDAATLLADGLSNQALSMLDLGEPERAEAIWQQALMVDRHHPASVYNYGLHRWRCGQLTDTQLVAELEQLRASHSGEPFADHFLGLVNLERCDIALARRHLEQAVRQGSSDADIGVALTFVRNRADEDDPIVLRWENVDALALSRDGRVAIAGCIGGTVRIFDPASGHCLHTVRAPSVQYFLSVALNADGSRAMAFGVDTRIWVWDVESGRCVHSLRTGHSGAAVAWSVDGTFALTADRKGLVAVWDLVEGLCLRTLRQDYCGSSGFGESVAISADGRTACFYSGKDRRVLVSEIATGRVARSFDGYIGAAVSSDRKLVVSGIHAGAAARTTRASRIVLWELETGRLRRVLTHPENAFGNRCVADDGRLAVTAEWAGTEGVLRVWELDTGRCLRTMVSHSGSIGSIALSGDGRIALSAGFDGTVRVSRLAPAGPMAPWSYVRPRTVGELTAQADRVKSVIVEADRLIDGERWTAAAELLRGARGIPGYERNQGLLERWRQVACHGRRGALIAAWERYRLTGATSAVLGAGDRLVLTADTDRVIRVRELATGRAMRTLACNDEPGNAKMVFSTDGQYVLCTGADHVVRVWDVRTGICELSLLGHTRSVVGLAVSHDGGAIVTAGVDERVRVWDRWTGLSVLTLGCWRDPKIGVSGDGTRIIVASVDPDRSGAARGTLEIWNLYGDCLQTTSMDASLGWSSADIIVAPDGRTAFWPNGIDVQVWDLTAARRVATLSGHTQGVTAIAVSADGQLLLSASRDATIRVWDPRSGRCRLTMTGHTGGVNAVAIGGDGSLAASGSTDGAVRVWDLRTGDCVCVLDSGPHSVESVAITADGRTVLWAGNDQPVHVSELDWEYDFDVDATDSSTAEESGRNS